MSELREITEGGELVRIDDLKDGESQCSECYRVFEVKWPSDVFQIAKTRYCPRCGARL